MQFKHPEILYALFLLIIPIIVHLFQLRRFKKVAFTNVQFLKEVELQTRKSAVLKKLLTLLARLFLFAALIFAFAQPYIGATKKSIAEDTYIYVDNSYSMQAKGKDGELLKRAIQDIIKNTTKLENVTLVTNNKVYKNLSGKELKNTLLSINYYPVKTDINTILLKIKSNSSPSTATRSKNVFLISDFQKINLQNSPNLDSLTNYYITKLAPLHTRNVSIDSVFITSKDNEAIHIKTRIKSHGKNENNMAVSLFNNEALAGKSSVSLTENTKTDIEFTIPSTQSFQGKIEIDDGYLPFDNTLYFTINKPKKINVTAIGTKNEFLSKIYTNDEFNFVSTSIQTFDYNSLETQHLVILNELKSIPNGLTTALKEFIGNGGSLAIIPSTEATVDSYTSLLRTLNLGKLTAKMTNELAVSTINFSHPFLKGVFEKKVKNFQYPTVKSSYEGHFRNASAILSFENGRPFISKIPAKNGIVYWFSAAIDTQNSNFKSSPLIVPIFYNFGLYSANPSQLYYTIGTSSHFEVNVKLKKDEVIHLVTNEQDFIPQQQIAAKKVVVTTESNPLKSGFISVQHDNESIKSIAYNYNRKESEPSSVDVKEVFKEATNSTYTNSVNEAFTIVSAISKTTNLWHLFIVLALLFLLTEMVLLKFLKP